MKRVLFVLDGAEPRWTEEGQPVCSLDRCPSFRTKPKRCTYRGMNNAKPALHCEPAIIELARRARGGGHAEGVEDAAQFVERALDPPNAFSRALAAGIRAIAPRTDR